MARHVEAMLALKRSGAVAFDYGNNIRKQAFDAGCKDAFEIPGFVPEYIRPLFCEGRVRFAGSRFPEIRQTFARPTISRSKPFPDHGTLNRWLRLARDRIHFQGLPARICWLGYGERAEMGEAINDLVKRGDLKAPIAIGRDHLDTGSVASPFRETEKACSTAATLSQTGHCSMPSSTPPLAHLDIDPQWRRRRHRLFATRWNGCRGRW